jgi:hypothetical protein
MKTLLTICALLFSTVAQAQPRPGSFTTIITTGNITDGGLLFVAGFGNSLFSAGGTGPEQVTIRNTTAGGTNKAVLALGNDVSSGIALLEVFSSTWATSGAQIANSTLLAASGAGGLTFSSNNGSPQPIRFFVTSTEAMRVLPSGGFVIGGTTDPGAKSIQIDGGGQLVITGVTFSNLGATANGTMQFCTNCTPASNPCTGGGSGTFAFFQNSAWKCF